MRPTHQDSAAPPPAGGGGDARAEGSVDSRQMVAEQIAARGVTDARVLRAMRVVPRHEFVPDELQPYAYDDRPLPNGHGQTISQPYVVAAMTELARIGEGARVLEIGTGCGYQAAVLAEVGAEVYSIEILAPLAEQAAETLARLGYGRVTLRVGDGYQGWPEAAPFDAILVTAAPPRVPRPLKEQLAIGGRLVIPVGDAYQDLVVITRTADGFTEQSAFPVRFVPMVGEAQR
jgi:protein-L-isoaspartate(D-aspartate) O-methyltransferase